MLAGATAALMLLSPTAWAAGPGGGGGGVHGGGGGGAGGGGAGGGGGGGGGTTTGSVYSDLVIALRDANGAPILKKYVVPATTETAETTEYCVQPVSYEQVPGVTASTNPVDGRAVWVIPLQGAWIAAGPLPISFTGACDPQPQYAALVSEVVLERLNLARTADNVIATKLADVTTKFRLATTTTLESTGRISNDGTPIDASPENAAIYQSLMKTGTIPGLPASPTTIPGPPASIGPVGGTGSNSQFDAWELAAMNIGAAASKSTPLTLDAVEYYNRMIGFPTPADPTATPPVPEYVSPWGVSFVRSENPDSAGTEMTTGERFVNYDSFTYNRSQTFKGSVTWLDVPSLTWKVSKITDVVPFTNLSDRAIGNRTLTGITAFAQLADDVRALCNFIPDNTFIPGFYMDVPGVDTTEAQLKAIHDPAVDLGTLPENVFQTYPFQMTASLLNPWGGDLIDKAQLRLTIDADTALKAGDVTATATADGQAIPFTVDAASNLVGTWGPDTGFPVAPGYNVSTTFDVTVAAGAPVGAYGVTLELVDLDAPTTVLAQETGTITVNANASTVLWGDPLPKLATQGVAMTIPLQVYSPTAGTGQLALTVTGPGDDTTTPETEVTKAGDVTIYASNGSDMVPLDLTLNADGQLVGTWDAALVAGYTSVTWYTTVAVGALVGSYSFDVRLQGGNALEPLVVSVSAPESHGQKPPDAGDDTTTPAVSAVSAVAGDASADVTWTVSGTTAITEYLVSAYVGTSTTAIQTVHVPGAATSVEVTGLANGTGYTFDVVATGAAGTGPTSARSAVVVPATVPGAPALGAVSAGDAVATVTWSAPVDTGGSPITGYVVTAYFGTTVVQTIPASAAVTRVEVTGLANGTGYTFDVVATNAAGPGPTSAPSAVVVPAAVPGAPLTTLVTRVPFRQVLAAAPNASMASVLAATGETPLPLAIIALVLLGAGAMLQPRVRRALFTRH
ncbi:fibronectin type III domain protein [mine drainage metagenome]|uniref:Fibronectin type III domain protein n=1 Tax=mine drainage metagenome TaxID=410659 RepID=A0A1J5R2G3_9ZZZZ